MGGASVSDTNFIIPNNLQKFNPPFSQYDIDSISVEEFLRYNPAIKEESRNDSMTIDKQFRQEPEHMKPKDNLYTREQIGKMTSAEFAENEAAIMKQLKEIGIPTEYELKNVKLQEKPKSNKIKKDSGKGHWVTINGNHVFIED